MDQQFTPAYYQVKQDIKAKIASQVLKPGDLLPGRTALSEEYGCSWSTLNRAINELILEGVLTAQKGKGTFVAPRAPESVAEDAKPVKVWVCHPFPSVYATLSEMMDGLREEAYRRGRGIQFIDNGFQDESPQDLNGYIVVVPSNDQRDDLVRAWEKGQRFVVLNSDFEDVPFVCVNSDIYNASLQVCNYLLDLGHEKIGLLGLRDNFSNYAHRREAFEHAFRTRGIPYADDWFVGRPEDQLDAKDLYGDWLDRHPDCTAIHAADYSSALAVLETLGEKETQIPERVSFFASGRVPFASLLRVSLCSVLQPFHELGRTAMACLLDERWEEGTKLLPCELVFGQSAGRI